MGNRSFVVELKKKEDVEKIQHWLDGAGDESTEFGPYHCGMVALGQRHFVLLGCDGDAGVRAFCNVGFRWQRILSLGDPDFRNYLYQKIVNDGEHFRDLVWRKKS